MSVSTAKKNKKRRPFWTLDAETDPFHNCDDPLCMKCFGIGRVPKPFIWGAYSIEDDKYLEFTETRDAVEYFSKNKVLVYAHNGGKFDYHYLRDHINTDEPIMLINGRLARFRIGLSEFRDSLNIFPNTRLEDFGCKNEIDYELMEPERRADPNVMAEIKRYLKQDCVGLAEQIQRYRREYGTALTQASASMRYWKEHYYQMDPPRQSKPEFERCRPFYYGGRVQCFESGVKITDFKVADINSAYPYAMMRRHPISTNATASKRLPEGRAKGEGDIALQTSLIRLTCTARGCFPWRVKVKNHGEGCQCSQCRAGELFFPDDEGGNRNRTRVYTVTGWEFIAALDLNLVSNINIEEVLTFSNTVDFKDYIDFFYEMRLEADRKGDKAGKIFGKYFMNSLYGKFGADCSHYAEYTLATDDSIETWIKRGYQIYEEWSHGRTLMQRAPTEENLLDITSRWRFYNVATAASITGFVRSYLLRSLYSVSGAIYCDTDSIAARDVSALDFGKGLGRWKDEGDFDRFAIAGKKMYAFHRSGEPLEYHPDADEPSWKIASKGVNFARMEKGADHLIALARGAKIKHLPEVPTYSVSRKKPTFIDRSISGTFKDMSQAPDPQSKRSKDSLAPLVIRI